MAAPVTAAAPRAAGRPRSDDVTARVTDAAREAFSRKGFGPVTMSEVAAAAGVGLDSIYRRWPSKQALLVDVVARAFTAAVQVPDTGSVHGDLRLLVRGLARAVEGDLGRLLAVAVGEASQDPALAARLADAQDTRRAATLAVVDAAVLRGELRPGVDGHLVLDALGGLVWQRAWISGTSLPDATLDELVDAIVAGFAA